MRISKEEVERRMQRFERVLRDEGIKLTHQRLEIYREVAQTGDHPDADQVHQRVRARLPTVSLDTVYRTLWMLKDFGLVTTLGTSREPTRFDANLHNHHHFVCNRCGFTRDFYSEGLDTGSLSAAVGALGRVESSHVEARGLCRECIEEKH